MFILHLSLHLHWFSEFFLYLLYLHWKESFAGSQFVSFRVACDEGSAMMETNSTFGQNGAGPDCSSSRDDLQGDLQFGTGSGSGSVVEERKQNLQRWRMQKRRRHRQLNFMELGDR